MARLCSTKALHAGGVQALALDHRLELLRDGLFRIITVRALRDHHVHLGRLGADNLHFQRVRRQVHLAPVRLVDGDGRNLTENLHLDALAVDKLGRRDQTVKNKRTLLARVHHNAVDFALDLEG